MTVLKINSFFFHYFWNFWNEESPVVFITIELVKKHHSSVVLISKGTQELSLSWKKSYSKMIQDVSVLLGHWKK